MTGPIPLYDDFMITSWHTLRHTDMNTTATATRYRVPTCCSSDELI